MGLQVGKDRKKRAKTQIKIYALTSVLYLLLLTFR